MIYETLCYIFGTLIVLVSFFTFLFPSRKVSLILKGLSDVFTTCYLTFILLATNNEIIIASIVTTGIAIFRDIIFFFRNKYELLNHRLWPLLFCVIFGCSLIWTYRSPLSLLPVFGSFLSTASLYSNDQKVMKGLSICSFIIYIVYYSILIPSSNALSIFTLISYSTGFIGASIGITQILVREKHIKSLVDFVVTINRNRDVKILQLTDFQPIDTNQQRYEGRLDNTRFNEPYTKELLYNKLYRYIEEQIKDTDPDLILVTGDIVYGEFDDNGSNFIEICKYMDSFKIPWAPIFGNHDNESKMGVEWQCEQFKNYKYCLFKRNDLTGNGNYSIGIIRHNELVNVIYMIDSNGTTNAKTYTFKSDYPIYNENEKIETNPGIFPDQINWIEESASKIDGKYHDVTKVICTHIPPDIIREVSMKNHYQKDAEWMNKETYTLGVDKEPVNGDSGTKGERYSTCPTFNLWDVLHKYNFTHLFCGHDHINNISILCDGIRVTFGVKTGTFDYYSDIGGTLITLNTNNEISFEHKFTKLDLNI